MRWEADLVRDIRYNESFDDEDGNQGGRIQRDASYGNSWVEFTDCNRQHLTDQFMTIRDKCRTIVEIGVHRNGAQSSTHCFLNNKRDDTVYVGIDLDDKTFLNNTEKNIYTIRGDSSNIDQNIEQMKSYGVDQIDFLFIDGLHSINQVLKDWEYTRILSPNGIVGFHDTSEHPGPNLFIRALDPAKWNVIVNCCPTDWGIGFAWPK